MGLSSLVVESQLRMVLAKHDISCFVVLNYMFAEFFHTHDTNVCFGVVSHIACVSSAYLCDSPPRVLVALSGRRGGQCVVDVSWDVGPVGYTRCLSVKIFVCVNRLPCGCCFQSPGPVYPALLHQMFCYLRFLELMIWEGGIGSVWLIGWPRGKWICN